MNKNQLKVDSAQAIDYKLQLVQTQKVFENVSLELLTCMVNLAMSGELSTADNFVVGDVLTFHESDFRKLDDPNVQLIFKVLDTINTSYETMTDINDLEVTPE